MYEEDGNTFRPDETIVLYVESVGFDHMPVLDDQGNTLYLMNITADYRISSANGTELLTMEDVPVGSIVSHRSNTELFLELTQESPFPIGDYLINYIVKDGISGRFLK